MKARIKFQKYGAMKFVGHLDIMRYFQKLFRRANIDSEYTKGFSPHQIMSFAAPLGVGLTSDAEYVDVQLLSSDEPERMVERINEVITEGFKIIDFHPLLEREENTKNVTAMALVASADYLVSFKNGYSLDRKINSKEAFTDTFRKFMEQQEIVIDKKTKTSEKAMDIKPMISFFAFNEEEYDTKRKDTLTEEAKVASERELVSKPVSMADRYDNDIKVYLQLDTGSSVNLKPELVMEAFYDFLELPFEKFAWQVHRLEVYTKNVETGKLAALNQVER